MNRNGYSAGGVKLSFWFLEFRKTVSLLDEGKDWDAIKQLAVDENIYGCPTTARAKQIFTTVSARIKCLDPSFYQIFLTSDVSSQKLFALAAAMLQDTLFFDFVYEVVREKMILGMNEFSQSDISIFFKDKAMQDAKVAEWTDLVYVTCTNLRRFIREENRILKRVMYFGLQYLSRQSKPLMGKIIT